MTPPDDEQDQQLLARHVRGDPEAFGGLVLRHRDRLYAVALRTLGDADDAADAVQEALLSAYRRAGTFRGDAAVTTWLHRIVVNACLDLVRRRAVRPVVPLSALERGEPGEAGGDPGEAAPLQLDLVAALRRLPFDQRVAVVLVDVEGYSVAQAAAVLDVPDGTVKSRCARGRARLAADLPGYGNRPGARDVPGSGAVDDPRDNPGNERAGTGGDAEGDHQEMPCPGRESRLRHPKGGSRGE